MTLLCLLLKQVALMNNKVLFLICFISTQLFSTDFDPNMLNFNALNLESDPLEDFKNEIIERVFLKIAHAQIILNEEVIDALIDQAFQDLCFEQENIGMQIQNMDHFFIGTVKNEIKNRIMYTLTNSMRL